MSRFLLLPLTLAALLGACAGGTSKRVPQVVIDDDDMAAIGTTAFEQLKHKGQMSADFNAQSFVRCVADHLVAELSADDQAQRWETIVFEDTSANAFALPGGKIGVHRGMLDVIADEGQLAAVLAHELGHITHRHAALRVSGGFAAEAAIAAVQTYRGDDGPQASKALYALLGLGTHVGTPLPYSAAQESAADAAAVRLLARAGYNPMSATALWSTLQTQPASPWLTSHPDPNRHIDELNVMVKSVAAEYTDARAAGKQPRCRQAELQ